MPRKPKEAMDFLRRKQVVESEAWDDFKWGEHSHAFTVAHSVGANVLNDMQQILLDAMDNGQSFDKTKRQIKQLMSEKGWYGRPDIDPLDDKDRPDKKRRREAKKYINWRIGIIYQQNQLTAYSAGQTRKLQSVEHIYPYWQYKQQQRKTKRQAHSAYHNMILRADDPAWETITPPNGWRCSCYRSPLTKEQADREWGKTLPEHAPPIDKTWQYDPAREALTPNWKSYNGLRNSGALRKVMQNYRSNLADIQMSQREWRVYSERLLTQ